MAQRVRRWFADQWIGFDGSIQPEAGFTQVDAEGCAPTALDRVDEGDAGMSTVEYAVGTVVAAAFAAVLYKIVTGDSVVSGLTSLVNSALHTSL